jgi:hypothetical protein
MAKLDQITVVLLRSSMTKRERVGGRVLLRWTSAIWQLVRFIGRYPAWNFIMRGCNAKCSNSVPFRHKSKNGFATRFMETLGIRLTWVVNRVVRAAKAFRWHSSTGIGTYIIVWMHDRGNWRTGWCSRHGLCIYVAIFRLLAALIYGFLSLS